MVLPVTAELVEEAARRIRGHPPRSGRAGPSWSRAGANIVDVEHRRLAPGVSARQTQIALLVETLDAAHTDRVEAALTTDGYPVRREPL